MRPKKISKRDISKDYPKKQFIAKLRRFADALERGEKFVIQVAGERITVPHSARVNIEHERSVSGEELEFQVLWNR
jgi:amphi-Trp domain-containing protein